jgi:hypothetical protein
MFLVLFVDRLHNGDNVARPRQFDEDKILAAVHVQFGIRPAIWIAWDIANSSLLADLVSYRDIKLIGSFGKIIVRPSARAAAILGSRRAVAPYRTL